MPSFNQVTLVGHLTRDPELRYTPKGTAIAQFGLAMNRVWTDGEGDKKEDVTFVDCKVFGKTAETLAQHVKKGHPLLVSGRLDQETWEDKKTKENRSRIVVVCEDFRFLKAKEAE